MEFKNPMGLSRQLQILLQDNSVDIEEPKNPMESDQSLGLEPLFQSKI